MARSSGFILSDTPDRLWAEASQASTRTILCLLYGATSPALVGWPIHRVYGMHRSTVIIRRHKGWTAKGFTGCALADLTLLVDAVNRRIVQKERYLGFQVMVGTAGGARTPAAAPPVVLPPAPELTREPTP